MSVSTGWWAAAGGLLCAGALAIQVLPSYVVDADAEESCERGTAAGYAQLEAVADRLMGDLPHRVDRIGGCSESGRPHLEIAVSVRGWKHRSKAFAYLRSEGLRRGPVTGSFLADGGSIEVLPLLVDGRGWDRRVVQLVFRPAGQRPEREVWSD